MEFFEAIHKRRSVRAYLLPVAILTVGYPAEIPLSTPRRSLEELVYYVR